jgi:hypothetical protein
MENRHPRLRPSDANIAGTTQNPRQIANAPQDPIGECLRPSKLRKTIVSLDCIVELKKSQLSVCIGSPNTPYIQRDNWRRGDR